MYVCLLWPGLCKGFQSGLHRCMLLRQQKLGPSPEVGPCRPRALRVFLFFLFYFNLIFSLLCKCFGYRETKQISSFSYVILLRAIRTCCMYLLYCPKFRATSFVFLFCCFFMFFSGARGTHRMWASIEK